MWCGALSLCACYQLLVFKYASLMPFDNRGAALLVEAADMGDPDALYELGCRLRVEVRLPALCTGRNIC